MPEQGSGSGAIAVGHLLQTSYEVASSVVCTQTPSPPGGWQAFMGRSPGVKADVELCCSQLMLALASGHSGGLIRA